LDSHVAIPREAIPSVVFVHCKIPAEHPSSPVLGEERMGAGIVVAPGRVLTAHYLVLGATKVEVSGIDEKTRAVERFELDHETGLALICLKTNGSDLRPARLGRGEDVSPGWPVFLMTCTNERERKGATGHVTVVGPFEAFWEYMLDRAFMTTAINPGLAGAGLFDGDARLIGVVSLGLAAVGRYSLAIPLDLYLARREEMESGDVSRSRTPRAWIGFYPQGYDGGVAITGVVPGGPADKAGLTRGDLILSVDGHPVSTLRDLYREIWKKKPGEALGLQVLRESAIRVVEVVSGDRYEFYR
jgi:S1-C subfamily serine protease